MLIYHLGRSSIHLLALVVQSIPSLGMRPLRPMEPFSSDTPRGWRPGGASIEEYLRSHMNEPGMRYVVAVRWEDFRPGNPLANWTRLDFFKHLYYELGFRQLIILRRENFLQYVLSLQREASAELSGGTELPPLNYDVKSLSPFWSTPASTNLFETWNRAFDALATDARGLERLELSFEADLSDVPSLTGKLLRFFHGPARGMPRTLAIPQPEALQRGEPGSQLRRSAATPCPYEMELDGIRREAL